ncbi:skeletal muscle/kidney enriched inositol 5-phosphatase [Sparassis latifolia]
MPGKRLLVEIASYNTNLQGDEGVSQDLVDWLCPTLDVSRVRERKAPDIIAVGFQELLPLHLGFAGLSNAVINNRNTQILSQIEAHSPSKERYSLIAKVVNVGVALLVYGRDDSVARTVCDVQTQWTGCGPAYMGNKGAVGVRFRVPGEDGGIGEVYTFVCAHLTAHSHELQRRIHDFHHVVRTLIFPALPSSESRSPTTIYSTSHLFFFGDLNFRLAIPASRGLADPSQRSSLVETLTDEEGRRSLRECDELLVERDIKGSIFMGLREGEFWRFNCSYKYKLGEVDNFDPKRIPAWTDRIMYTTFADTPDASAESSIANLLYTTIPSYTRSDHKPVVALLLLPPSEPTAPTLPVLQLAPDYHPAPDPLAAIKRYTGRLLDRVLGYVWWAIVLLGAGSTIVGICNFVLGLGIWGWWNSSWWNSRGQSAEQS